MVGLPATGGVIGPGADAWEGAGFCEGFGCAGLVAAGVAAEAPFSEPAAASGAKASAGERPVIPCTCTPSSSAGAAMLAAPAGRDAAPAMTTGAANTRDTGGVVAICGVGAVRAEGSGELATTRGGGGGAVTGAGFGAVFTYGAPRSLLASVGSIARTSTRPVPFGQTPIFTAAAKDRAMRGFSWEGRRSLMRTMTLLS